MFSAVVDSGSLGFALFHVCFLQSPRPSSPGFTSTELDPRSLAQARDALIVQTDRLHRLRSEKDEAVAETTRIDAELQQTRAQWKKAVDAHDEATAAMRDVQRELDDAKEALRRALTRRDADAAEMEEARSAVSLF